METKQTAVQWLAEQMLHPNSFNPYIEQALQMEREQIEEAYIAGDQGYYRLEEIKEFAKDYYIETYGGQDE
jgi:hypothetical protein